MDAKLFLIVFICIAALGLVLGIAIGFNLSEGQRCVGDLVIAPGDEDADHYMFLDLAKSPETLARAGDAEHQNDPDAKITWCSMEETPE